MPDRNAKHAILEFVNMAKDGERTYQYTTTVYLLNPGDFFHGFGGSSRSLAITKTASLITRTKGPWGLRDFESNLTCPDAWDAIRRGAADALTRSMANDAKLKPTP